MILDRFRPGTGQQVADVLPGTSAIQLVAGEGPAGHSSSDARLILLGWAVAAIVLGGVTWGATPDHFYYSTIDETWRPDRVPASAGPPAGGRLGAMTNRAGTVAQPSDLVDLGKLLDAYTDVVPDPSDPDQRVAFGTSGHRGISFERSFNEAHILAITQAVCEYRAAQGITGPLFIGKDTHALSGPAWRTAIEVLLANDVDVRCEGDDDYTPTPAVSHAILTGLPSGDIPQVAVLSGNSTSFVVQQFDDAFAALIPSFFSTARSRSSTSGRNRNAELTRRNFRPSIIGVPPTIAPRRSRSRAHHPAPSATIRLV